MQRRQFFVYLGKIRKINSRLMNRTQPNTERLTADAPDPPERQRFFVKTPLVGAYLRQKNGVTPLFQHFPRLCAILLAIAVEM